MRKQGSNLPPLSSGSQKGVTIGTANTASAISAKRKLRLLEKSVPADIIIINERVQLDETDFKPEENTDRVGFTQYNGYFPNGLSNTDLLNAKITFAKIFAKDSKFSLTDSKPPCDLEEYGILREGLENRFKSIRKETIKNRQLEGDSIKTRALLDQTIKIKNILNTMDENANDCGHYAGPEFQIKSVTSINNEQMQRLIRSFSLMVLEAIHPVSDEEDKHLFRAPAADVIQKILDNKYVDNEAVEKYLQKYQKESEIPRLIGLILSEYGPRGKVQEIIKDEESTALLKTIEEKISGGIGQSGGGQRGGNSAFERFKLTIQNKKPNEKLYEMIEWVVSELDRCITTKKKLQKDLAEYKMQEGILSTSLSDTQREIGIRENERNQCELMLQKTSSNVARKFGNSQNNTSESAESFKSDEVQDELFNLQKMIDKLNIENSTIKNQLRVLTQQLLNEQIGGKSLEDTSAMYKDILNNVETTITASNAFQKGGAETFDTQLDELETLTRELKTQMGGNSTSEIDKYEADIAALRLQNSQLKAMVVNEETAHKAIDDRILAVADMIGKNASHEEIEDIFTDPDEPLAVLYNRILEDREKSKVSSTSYNICFLNYFISFFISEIFMSEKSEEPKAVYSTLFNNLLNITNFNTLLKGIFDALQSNDDKEYSVEDNDLKNYLEIPRDTVLNNRIINLFKLTFPHLYETYKNKNVVGSVPYLVLFAEYLVLARNYLNSNKDNVKCPISKVITENPVQFEKTKTPLQLNEIIKGAQETSTV